VAGGTEVAKGLFLQSVSEDPNQQFPPYVGSLNSSLQSLQRAGLSNPGSDFRRSERSILSRILVLRHSQ
jgi:hypothetical protein